MVRSLRSLSAVLLALGSLLAASRAAASDGVIEINHARALAGGVTAGDAPGYPVVINEPGSYRLTSNLVQQAASTGIVHVNVGDVTLDLGGFELSGPFTCPGQPASCSLVNLTGAVAGSGSPGVTVRNGRIRRTARGIWLGDGAVVSDVVVEETTSIGVTCAADCTIERVTASRNGIHGISVGSGSVTRSHASDNGQIGISVSEGIVADSVARRNADVGIAVPVGRISGSLARDNGGVGLYVAAAGSVIEGSVASSNDGHGVSAGSGALVTACSSQNNLGDGFRLEAGAQLAESTARSNLGLGLRGGHRTSYRGITLTSNNQGAETQIGPIAPGDQVTSLGGNLCGSDAVCP